MSPVEIRLLTAQAVRLFACLPVCGCWLDNEGSPVWEFGGGLRLRLGAEPDAAWSLSVAEVPR